MSLRTHIVRTKNYELKQITNNLWHLLSSAFTAEMTENYNKPDHVDRSNPADIETTKETKERRQGHMKDALALGGEEGRDKLR